MSNAAPVKTLELHYRQGLALNTPATEVLYGGAGGSGKSHLMRVAAIGWCIAIPGLQIYMFRRTLPDLLKNHMSGPSSFPVLLADWVKAGQVKINYTSHTITFRNGASGGFEDGSKIFLCHCQYERDVFNYQGAEIHVLLMDELTHFTESQYRYLRGRVRMVGLKPAPQWQHLFPRILCGSNPGGVGHGWVKQTFAPGTPEALMPRKMPKSEGGLVRQYIPALLDDNPSLAEADPEYESRLEGLGSPELVKAMRWGDWEVFVGQAFPEFTVRTHVIAPCMPPENAQIYTTFDWGFGKPFSWGWWFVDNDGRVIRFAEWYGWNGQPDQGLRLIDSEVAQEIKRREQAMGLRQDNRIIRLAGHDCFSRKPDFQGGGQGKSTAEIFAENGLFLTKADSTRHLKIRAFRERVKGADGRPMLLVCSNCTEFIRTIPSLVMDPTTMEDIDSKGEDHCLVGDTHVVTSRGNFKISELVGTLGAVLTAGGYWTDYRHCRLTRRNADVVRVTFSDGREVICTPDHRFLLASGSWAEAKDLAGKDCHVSAPAGKHIKRVLCASQSSMRRLKSSRASATGFAAHTSSTKASGCTGLCGSVFMGLSQKARTFTTETTTRATTRLITWSASVSQTISLCMHASMTILHGWLLAPRVLPVGMEATLGRNGTQSTITNTARALWESRSTRPVTSAGRHTKGRSILASALKSARFAIGNFLNRLRGSVASVGNPTWDWEEHALRLALRGWRGSSARAATVEPWGKADVYCLTADYTHAFAVEGGIVVHNCFDESTQIAMARPMPTKERGPAAANAYAKRIDQLASPASEGERFEREMINAFGRDPGPWGRAEMGEVMNDSSPY